MNRDPDFLFLSYINRSGSTFLSQQLSSSDHILVCQESDVLVRELLEDPPGRFDPVKGRTWLEAALNDDKKMNAWGMNAEDVEWDLFHPVSRNLDAFFVFLKAYRDAFKPLATTILFKAERLIYLFEKIQKACPAGINCVYFSLVRDIRGVYASQKRTPMIPGNMPMSQDPVRTSLDWNRFVKKSDSLQNMEKVRLLRYEDMILNYPGLLVDTIGKAGIKGFQPGSKQGDLYQRMPKDVRQIHKHCDQAPLAWKTEEWKQDLSDKEIGIIQCLSGRRLKKLKYVLIKVPVMKAFVRFSLPFELVYYYIRRACKAVSYRLKIGRKGNLQ